MAPAAKSVLVMTLPPGLGGERARVRMVHDVLAKSLGSDNAINVVHVPAAGALWAHL